ncbi:MAG: hypothetical protein KKE23_03465 [Nanoarchaeota archaeon]|nr:hypothetical protein [Nanoarchaeota archaeon]
MTTFLTETIKSVKYDLKNNLDLMILAAVSLSISAIPAFRVYGIEGPKAAKQEMENKPFTIFSSNGDYLGRYNKCIMSEKLENALKCEDYALNKKLEIKEDYILFKKNK